MRGFTGALGVRCDHCHVGQGDLANFDFASDDKPAKQKARVMLKMLQAINGTHLAELGEKRMMVTCTTCHRGLARPVPIEDVLEAAVDSAGVDAAAAKYDELRKHYYGASAYNFARGPAFAAFFVTALATAFFRSRERRPSAARTSVSALL